MKVKEMKEAIKEMADDDEIIFWGWNGKEATSRFYPLSFTASSRHHDGFISTMVSGYSQAIEPNIQRQK